MEFTYDGQNYKTDESGYTIYNREQYIQLPDGRYVFVEEWLFPKSWLGSSDPVPAVIDEVDGDSIPAEQRVAIAQPLNYW